MKYYIEVEHKFKLEDCEILKTRLRKLGAKKSGSVRRGLAHKFAHVFSCPQAARRRASC